MKKDEDHAYAVIMKVRNQPGVLVRVAQVFARRGHNIESLHVEVDTRDDSLSNMTIGAFGKKDSIDQIIAQIRKLVDVVELMLMEES
jgi:acetolactate synthase I/III small subunit